MSSRSANGSRACRRRREYSRPSGTVKCIFQLPAISGLRMILVAQYRDPGQYLPFQEFEGGAAPGRDEGHPLGQVPLLQGGHQVAATDDGLRVAAGQALCQRIRAVVEGRDFVDAEGAIPDDRRGAVAALQEALDS